MRSIHAWVKLSIGFIVTGVCLWLVLRKMEWDETWRTVQQADSAWLLLAVGFLAVGYLSRIVRWWTMLRALKDTLPLSLCVGPFLSSIALNNILPFRAGDILRVVGFQRHLDIAPIPVMSTLALERLLDFAVLLGFFFVGLIQVDDGALPHGLSTSIGWMTLLCFFMVVGIMLLPRRLLNMVAGLIQLSERRSWPFIRKIAEGLRQVFESLTTLQSPRLLLQLVLLSLAIWSLEGGVFFAVANAVHITDAGSGPWFALATGTLGTLLPSTPGYIGTFDYFTMLGLTAYHVAQPIAAIFALTVHVVLWLPLTVSGLTWLMIHKLKGSTLSLKISSPMTGSS